MTRSGLMLYVLSALADDDESPWLLHWMIGESHPDLEISELLAALDEIERRGWAVAWASTDDDPENPNNTGPPTAEYRKEAFDAYDDLIQRGLHRRRMLEHYGPWFHLTPAGEEELERLEREADDQL
jgi:hypothetical protein